MRTPTPSTNGKPTVPPWRATLRPRMPKSLLEMDGDGIDQKTKAEHLKIHESIQATKEKLRSEGYFDKPPAFNGWEVWKEDLKARSALKQKQEHLDGTKQKLQKRHGEEGKVQKKKKKKKKNKNKKEVDLRLPRCYLTREETVEYNRKVKESGGFDVGDLPSGVLDYCIKPLTIDETRSRKSMLKFQDMAKTAIRVYNEEHDTKYQFVKVIRVNWRMSIWSFYYITFEAKDDMTSSPPQNFQAYVRMSSEGEKTIKFCRVEQKSELREDYGAFRNGKE
ncbi:uncharacterized protein LOC131310593 isoform X3 [Rhododendron vialii]|uniref:uncharacterized protein LOC131310593 isoform X3 n=1 Tax=Rhododendron vialii TaxID=182163 RepID=UPI00265DF36D|nr:uncharacterized protein LOC131310593 isoform X3 [Rhododendron vialii]